MKIGSFAKVGTFVATTAITMAGLSIAPAAMADPAATPAVSATTLTGVGSDTTQDVLNEIAKTINTAKGSAWMASYNALGTPTVVVKGRGAAIPRANGSGEGFKMLQVSKGTLASSSIKSGTLSEVLTAGAETVGQIDYSRSSSNGSGASPTGIWSYVPFAKDALTLAVNPATLANNGVASIPNSIVKGASGDTASTLSWYSIYHCLARYVHTNASGAYVGVSGSATPLLAGATKATVIKPLLPKFGSGTRSYFVGQVGYTDSATLVSLTNPDTSCIVDTVNGVGVNEHDGTAIKAVGAGALAPFSIPQWVAQSKTATTGVASRLNGTVLLGNGDQPATTGAGASIVTNTAFPIKRVMYNVVPANKLLNPTTREYAIFNGKDSEVCKATTAITKMGFIPLTLSATPASTEDCGYTGNRFGAASAKAPASASIEFAQVLAGTAETVDVTVEGNTDAGTVSVFGSADYTTALNSSAITVEAGDLYGTYTAEIPASSTSGTEYKFKGKFSPTDSLFLASDLSSEVSVKAVGAYSLTVSDIPSRATTGSKVAVTATVAAGTDGALVGGNLVLVDAAGNELASSYLPERATSGKIEWTATSGSKKLAVVFEPENSSSSLVKKSAEQSINVAATAATVTATKISGWATATLPAVWFGQVQATSASTTKPVIKVAITKVGAAAATGTVKVLISTSKTGGTVLVAPVRLAADGTATITLPATKSWRVAGTAGGVTRYLNVVYSGDSNYYTVTKALQVKLTN